MRYDLVPDQATVDEHKILCSSQGLASVETYDLTSARAIQTLWRWYILGQLHRRAETGVPTVCVAALMHSFSFSVCLSSSVQTNGI
jgi:hypothetical protein